ncbi:hypothetical protein D1R32_gp426 [Tunisvirus fontaine2]|uniref:MORN repeat-containing protein n=1 Tax=Tunisvirus fontaine2 TaxID=1421067 RepID=V9SE15_9VIRU|nr:hypothetical protein D1R32_gp426 [Tunisvirus fontaine2]AHC55143.1 hypothetical protein TNS_ORF425 [Tunisvirus fontaine2]
MQKFLEKREVVNFSLVTEEKPNAEDYRAKVVEACKMPNYVEFDASLDQYKNGRHLYGINSELCGFSKKEIGVENYSVLPDGTRDGEFVKTCSSQGHPEEISGSYNLGKKHGKFVWNYGDRRGAYPLTVRTEIWEDGVVKKNRDDNWTVQNRRLFYWRRFWLFSVFCWRNPKV